MKVMPGVAMYIGRSQQEAEDKFEQLNALIPAQVALSRLGKMLGGVDLSGFALDEPMPDIQGNSARMSTPRRGISTASEPGTRNRPIADRSG